ncbi:MAG TPA: MarC family protein [Lentisphaeria bacterium]|nr:MarC family protein [Lentisphaeria bacterium]
MTILQGLHMVIALYLKLFFLLTPFFVLSTFLTITAGTDTALKQRLAVRIALGAAGVTLVIFFYGVWIMKIFGITVDAFRTGSGVLLLLVAVSLVYGTQNQKTDFKKENLMDLAIVPLAVPITAGPATLGTLMVMGLETPLVIGKIITAVSLLCAVASIGVMLFHSERIEKMLGRASISILSKITGLILSAIAAQMIVIGVRQLWFAP